MLEQFFAFIMLMIFTMFTYIGIHMSFEKDSKKHIPLLWEPGGLLYNLFKKEQKQFDKSDIKYRDGDNT
jgi:hypothetical protein